MDEQQEQQLVAGLKQKHQIDQVLRIAATDDTGEERVLYCRVPTRADVSTYSKAALKGAMAAAETFIAATLLHPDKQTVGEWFQRKPGLPAAFVEKLNEEIGLSAATTAKKL